MSLKWPHPMSFSADHPDGTMVSQLEWDDPRLYDADLLVPMHLVCNQRKGTGGMKRATHPNSRDWTL